MAITAGGLVFTGAMDAYLRAFDARSGEELWQGRLPVPGVANPMTYLWKGEQYVAIGAGGHSESGTTIGDSVVAFRLARPGEAPSLWSRTIDRPGGTIHERGDRGWLRGDADGGFGVQEQGVSVASSAAPSSSLRTQGDGVTFEVQRLI